MVLLKFLNKSNRDRNGIKRSWHLPNLCHTKTSRCNVKVENAVWKVDIATGYDWIKAFLVVFSHSRIPLGFSQLVPYIISPPGYIAICFDISQYFTHEESMPVYVQCREEFGWRWILRRIYKNPYTLVILTPRAATHGTMFIIRTLWGVQKPMNGRPFLTLILLLGYWTSGLRGRYTISHW